MLTIDQAAALLLTSPAEVASVADGPHGPAVTTTDGCVYWIVPDDDPDAHGKTGIMFAPGGAYRGSFPVYSRTVLEIIALEADEELADDGLAGGDAEPGDPVPDGTVNDVLEWVGDDPERAVAALAFEQAGKVRVSLITALEEIATS